MTILEAIIGSIYPYAVDEALILKTCIDNGLNEADDYSLAEKEKVARVSIDILRNIISLSSESKDGSSLSYNADMLKERIYSIALSNGFTDIASEYKPHSSITDRTNMW